MKARLLISLGLGAALVLALTLSIAAQEGADFGSRAYLPLIMRHFRAACAGAPRLISPANGANLNTLIPTFRFMAGSPAGAFSYVNLYLDSHPDFADPTYASIGTIATDISLQWTENLNPATAYYWRVQETCDGRNGPYSPTYHFVTGSGGVLLPAPTLTSPISGTVGLTRPVTLRWQPVAGAVSYIVHVRPAGMQGGWLLHPTGTSHVWRNAQPNTAYDWSVQAMNNYAFGAESALWRFATGSSQ